MNIPDRLKEERERLGYSQTAFAALGGASKGSQIAWEKGTAFPNAQFLAAIAEVGADVSYILTGMRAAPQQPTASAEALPAPTPTQRKILELMEGLDEEGEREIQEAIQKEKRRAQDRQLLGELKRQAGRAKHAA